MSAVAVKKSSESSQNGLMQTTLGAIGEYINGRGFKKSEWADKGLPIIRIQDLTGTGKGHNYFNGEIDDCHVVEPGDLLISWSATLGVYIWNGPKAALNQHIFKVVSKIDKKLHYYLVQHILEELYRKTHGSGMVHITKGKFEETPITIPETPEQQKQIVAKIEELFSHIDAGIAALKQSKQLLKQYRQSVLKAAVTGELSKEWREQNAAQGCANVAKGQEPVATKAKLEPASKLLERILQERRQKWEAQQLEQFKAKGKVPKDEGWKGKYKEPSAPDTSDLPELPEGWCWASVSQPAEIFGGLTKNPKREKVGNKLPYLRVANVYANELRLDEMEYIGVEDKELDKLLVNKGDLLVVEGNGSPDQIGRVAIWDGSISPCVHQNHLIKVRLNEMFMPEFVLLWLLSPNGRDYIRNVASSTSGLYTLSVNKVGSLPIPVLSLLEQRKIFDEVDSKLSSITVLEKSIDSELQRSERLKQSVLQSAFSGELK